MLQGIIPPMVTPLLEQDKLDVDGLERLIEHILAGGVHGLFILGTTGEAPSLSYKLRKELILRTNKLVRNRVPVLVGITDSAFNESINLAKFAADNGSHAVVLAPPYYFPAGQAELLEYVQHLAPQLPLPLYLYNMPGMTKITFEADTVRQMADIPGVVGLKDSSCNMIYFHLLRRTLRDLPEFSLLVGPEELLAESVLLGGQGGVNGGANLFPQLYVDLYNAAVEKDYPTINSLHENVIEVAATLYQVGQHGSSMIKGLKCALDCQGICSDFVSEPFHRFRGPERKKIQAGLQDILAKL